ADAIGCVQRTTIVNRPGLTKVLHTAVSQRAYAMAGSRHPGKNALASRGFPPPESPFEQNEICSRRLRQLSPMLSTAAHLKRQRGIRRAAAQSGRAAECC